MRVRVDNSTCNAAIASINLMLEQDIQINSSQLLGGDRVFNTKATLVESQEHGLAARDPNVFEKVMSLDLSSIRYVVPKTKKKGGALVPLSPEETYLLSQLQPASHASCVRNEYFLILKIAYEGCTCFADLPEARLPILVVPVE